MRKKRSLFLTPMERTMILPTRGSEIAYTRGGVDYSVALNDITHPGSEFEFKLDGDGTLTALRFFPMERPFVTTPVVIDVISVDGTEHRIAVRGNHRHDTFGNWIFDRGRPVVESKKRLDIADVKSVRVRFEFLLYGPEVGIAKRSRMGRVLPGGVSR